jgi:RNA polymerase sigma-70 factor (ECF subfamily)
MQQPPDQALMERIGHRDESALKALYDRYGALIFTLAYRKLGDHGLAEEVLQDVFLRCWEQAHTYRPEAGNVSAWLFGITRNRAIDVRRSRMQHAREREGVILPESDTLEEAHSADASEQVALHVTMQAALQQLTPAQRQAIELAYYGDMSQSEIAHHLGEPLGTVKTRMRSATEKLRRTLDTEPVQSGTARVAPIHD